MAILFAFACLLSIAVFIDAWSAMVRVWLGSETFAHGFIALPCAAWMLWRRRADWSALPQRVWWPGALALFGTGAIWLIGRLGGVDSIEQLGAVATIPATILLLVGPAVTRAVAFPLAFLFFAVPIGEFLTPWLMDYTADATVAALRWSGIPVFREGLHFTLPTGRWSVVEACSGLRYLIASLALGVLYAYLQFRTLKYRLAFIALAALVPIVANWVRAYGIVLLGHVSNMKLATGADHLIYGWIFFGVVMAILFWIGSRWREPSPVSAAARTSPGTTAEGAVETRSTPDDRTHSGRTLIVAAFVAIIAALLWRPISAGLLDLTKPVDAVTAFHADTQAFLPAEPLEFAPRFSNATAAFHGARSIEGTVVDVHAFYYARQHETQEMIHTSHTVVRADDFEWPILGISRQALPWGTVRAYRIRHTGGNAILVWQWYAIGSQQTASAYRAKAATAWSLLTGQGDHSLAIVLATPLDVAPSGTKDEAMRQATHRLTTMADALQPAIRTVAHGRTAPAATGRASRSQ